MRTYLHNLQLFRMRIHHPTPKAKESLHQIKTELNSSETFNSECSSETPLRTNKRDFVTPYPVSKKGRRPSSLTLDRNTTNPSYFKITSALLVLNLASNAAFHSSFRPERRPHHVPNKIIICPPLKSNLMFRTSLFLALVDLVILPLQRWRTHPHFVFLIF